MRGSATHQVLALRFQPPLVRDHCLHLGQGLLVLSLHILFTALTQVLRQDVQCMNVPMVCSSYCGLWNTEVCGDLLT